MSNSVSRWFGQMRTGEEDAVQKLWDRYSESLVNLAKKKLGNAPTVAADEEDVAQSVFKSVWRGARAGRFNNVTSRDELWWILLYITRQKVANYVRRETAVKRGSGLVIQESNLAALSQGNAVFSIDKLISDAPNPELLNTLEDEYQALLKMLRDDKLRMIAVYRIEGYTVAEIATKLKITIRSVERKLALIRNQWSGILDNSGA